MKNVVKHKTAIELKEAGFPQPKPAFGQIWYDSEGTPCIVFTEAGDFVTNDGTVFYPPSTEELAFAPKAADILRKLPDYALAFDNTSNPFFFCYDMLRRIAEEYPSKNTNPAEVCAAVYLKKAQRLIKK